MAPGSGSPASSEGSALGGRKLPGPKVVPGQKKARHKRWTRIAAASTVVVLVGFAAFLVFTVSKQADKKSLVDTQAEGCKSFLDGIASQIQDYQRKRGRLPKTLAELRDPELPSTYDAEPWDCWNKPIEYRIVEGAAPPFRLRSLGPDLEPDTADDIVWPSSATWK